MNMRDLVPWDRGGGRAMSPFAALQQEMNRLFDEAFGSLRMPGWTGFGTWPHAEISETAQEIRASFELPGVQEKDIEVALEDGELVVRGEKRGETEDRDRRFSERFYGRFERRIPLHGDVDEDRIKAEFRNGVLTVTMPKSAEQAHAKRIPINAG